jgi:hypothetical protein
MGGWVSPRAGLDAVVKRKIPSLRRDSNPHHPARSPGSSDKNNDCLYVAVISSSMKSLRNKRPLTYVIKKERKQANT